SALNFNGRAAAQIELFQAVWTGSGYWDGTLRVYGMVFDGTSLAVRVNAELPSVVAAQGPIAAVGTDGYVGGRQGARQNVAGDIAEVIVVGRGMSEVEYARTYDYLAAKYGL